MSNIVKALSLKYQREIESARANIEVYMNNPAGIGEHPDIVAAVDSELIKLSTAEDKLKSLESNFPEYEISVFQKLNYLPTAKEILLDHEVYHSMSHRKNQH